MVNTFSQIIVVPYLDSRSRLQDIEYWCGSANLVTWDSRPETTSHTHPNESRQVAYALQHPSRKTKAATANAAHIIFRSCFHSFPSDFTHTPASTSTSRTSSPYPTMATTATGGISDPGLITSESPELSIFAPRN